MGDQYYHMPPHVGYYQHEQHNIPPQNFEHSVDRIRTMSTESLQHSDMDESAQASTAAQGPPKSKRRPVHGPDHVKHRRTRSGCFTCRQRRVKCDETHPTCDRCRKAKRDCQYPVEPSTSKPPSVKSRSSLPESADNSSGDEHDGDSERLPVIPDEEGFDDDDVTEPASAVSTRQAEVIFPGHDSMSPSSKEKSPTTATETEAQRAARRTLQQHRAASRDAALSPKAQAKFRSLPKDVRRYIEYHRDELSHHHYALKYDGGDFLKSTYLEIALGYEPLLYAICAFSSYFHELSKPQGRVQTVLSYYDKSVRLLRQSLLKMTRPSIPTLLTILQLASFEESLGDWVNLLGHQKAAYELITQLFTPQNVMQSETHRKIITWYIRFDIMGGLMSGNVTTLSREWHAAVTDFYTQQARARPNDLSAAFEERFALARLLATDISLVFGKRAKGLLSDMDFMTALGDLRQRQESMMAYLDTAFEDKRTYIKDFPYAPKNRENALFPELDPNFLLGGEMYTWNLIKIDLWGLSVMFRSQLAQIDRSIDPQEVVDLAFNIGKMFESLQYTEKDPRPIILGAQASVGIAATAMPKDPKHVMWCRRQYAQIECSGYIYPAVLRKRMSDAWNEDVTTWWLPEDQQPQCPTFIRQIREFLEYRATIPQDAFTEDVRDMKGLFNAMSIEDPEQREMKSTGTTNSDDFIDLGAFGGGEGGLSFESSPDVTWQDGLQSTESLGYYSAPGPGMSHNLDFGNP